MRAHPCGHGLGPRTCPVKARATPVDPTSRYCGLGSVWPTFLACSPQPLGVKPAVAAGVHSAARSVRATLIYNVLATIYFVFVGSAAGRLSGIILRTAIVLHAMVSFVLGRAWLSANKK
jgi:hypothetical protein